MTNKNSLAYQLGYDKADSIRGPWQIHNRYCAYCSEVGIFRALQTLKPDSPWEETEILLCAEHAWDMKQGKIDAVAESEQKTTGESEVS